MKERTVTTIWLNNKKQLWKSSEITKPCHLLKYCPYGGLVEEFPLREKKNIISCKTFGHDCPAYYLSEEVFE